MKRKSILDLFEWALRINVFLKLMNYGLGKIIGQQFYRPGSIPAEIAQTPLEQTSSYNLAWTFFGHSEGYIFFIGISQIIAVTLFLIPRTKMIGGLMLIPILLNIILVDIFFSVAYGALFSASFYLVSVGFVLLRNRTKLIESMTVLMGKAMDRKKIRSILWLGITGLFFVLVFLLEQAGIEAFGFVDP